MLYLSSDGYYDQMGGEHNKRLTSKHFSKFLSQIYQLELREQYDRAIINLLEWQGSNEDQTDDILLMGIRL